MLKAVEAAALLGKNSSTIRRWAENGKIASIKIKNECGVDEYRIPLTALAALDPTLPQRYLAQHAPEGAAEAQGTKRGRGRPRKDGSEKPAAESKPLEEYTAEERGEIAFWTQAVQDWRGYRAGYRDKAAADEA